MDTALTVTTAHSLLPIVAMVIDGLDSNHSKRSYTMALNDFMAWYAGQPGPTLNRAAVMAYRKTLIDQGLAPSSVNVRMSAIRRMAREANHNGLLTNEIAAGIADANGVASKGVRAGNWLTKQQAEQLLNTPDVATLKGIRDRAILAVLIGAGLRRSEVVSLQPSHIQQREGRWVIVDIIGKGNRVRSVPIAPWVKTCIDAWTEAASIFNGYIFRGMNRHGQIINEQISDQAVGDLVSEYGAMIDQPTLAAHDLRRTFAKLSRKGGAALEQISLVLGHASIDTTKKYLGGDLDLENSPSDFIKLRIKADS
jgi:site-specific recombinase XerD